MCWKNETLAGRVGPLPGPESGLLSNTWKWVIWGDLCGQSRRLYWEGAPGEEQEGKRTQEECSATWFAVSGFTVLGLVSGLSLSSHSNSGSFLGVLASLSQDGFQWGGFWDVGRTYGLAPPVSFWPSPNSSGWWWLGNSVFLTRISCSKITHVNGYYGASPGWAVSISVSSNKTYKPCLYSLSLTHSINPSALSIKKAAWLPQSFYWFRDAFGDWQINWYWMRLSEIIECMKFEKKSQRMKTFSGNF